MGDSKGDPSEITVLAHQNEGDQEEGGATPPSAPASLGTASPNAGIKSPNGPRPSNMAWKNSNNRGWNSFKTPTELRKTQVDQGFTEKLQDVRYVLPKRSPAIRKVMDGQMFPSSSFEVKHPEVMPLLEPHLQMHLSPAENAVKLLKSMLEVPLAIPYSLCAWNLEVSLYLCRRLQ